MSLIPEAATIWNRQNTSVHVENAKPVLGVSASSFSQLTGATPTSLAPPPTAASQTAAFQAAAYIPTPKEIPPGQANQAMRSSEPEEEKNDVSADSISQPQITRSSPNITLPPPLETLRYSTLESPRIDPYVGPSRERERLDFEKFPTRDVVDSALTQRPPSSRSLPQTNKQKALATVILLRAAAWKTGHSEERHLPKRS